MARTRAAIYARFSSHNQRSESIEIQLEKSHQYCEENGLEVVREYCDYAQTGRDTDRREFQAMLADSRRGLFDYVVISKVTRIMRNRDEMALARIMLRKAGVDILYADEQLADGSAGVLQLGMLEVLAEYESALDSERIRDGIQKNARRCMANGRPMYGWDIVDGRYVVNEREAAVMRRMRDMLLAGTPVAEIVRAVASERGKRGKPLQQGTVTRMLRRRQNCGTYVFAGFEKEGGMPALWTREEQDMIDRILDDHHRPRRTTTSEDYPLTGKLFCVACGLPMAGTSGTSKTGASYHYYRCRGCRRLVGRGEIEGRVARAVVSALGSEAVRERIADLMCEAEEETGERPQSELIADELKGIERAYANVWRAIEEGYAPPGGRERIEELMERQSLLEAELRVARRLESARPDRERVLFWLEQMAGSIGTDRLISTFVSSVHLDGDDVHVAFTFDGHEKGEHPFECSPTLLRVETNHIRKNPRSPIYVTRAPLGFVVVARL